MLVTTPQQVSLADTRRAVQMYRKLNIPPLGLIENMSHFVCPDCGHESDIFGKGGGERLAADLSVPFLGRIPLYAADARRRRHRRARRHGGAGFARRPGPSAPQPSGSRSKCRSRRYARRAIPLVPVN